MDMADEETIKHIEFFHFGVRETILFEAWTVTSVLGFILSCILIGFLAFLLEGLIVLRKKLLQKYATDIHHKQVEREATETTRLIEEQAEGIIPILTWPHVLLTLLYTLQIVVLYLLMLIVMTYNVYLFFSVVLGTCLGYFSFAWRNSVMVNVKELKR